jgi:aldehyde:ferredoxin oxidoreductase
LKNLITAFIHLIEESGAKRMFKYGGYRGSILRVNLSKKEVKKEPLAEEWAEKFLGGRGFGARVMFDEVKPRIDPFNPINKLIFATGPLTGTIIPTVSKTTVISKSPLTNTIVYSLGAGYFAPRLKFAGFDAIIVEGKAQKPVYLWVHDGEAELRDAGHLWGLQTNETKDKLRKETDEKASVACIGPAGENLVRFACIVIDARKAGRGGTGAVMGSKKLKAIATSGEATIKVADINSLEKIVKESYELIAKDPTCTLYKKMGTPRSVGPSNELGLHPTRNYQETYFEGHQSLIGEVLREKFIVKVTACYRCPVACEKICEVKQGKYAGAVAEGLEYETVWAFGAQCGNSSLEAVIAADMYCDNLGLDTISTGNTIGFAMECYEKGLISIKDTGGLELKFGNDEAMIEMIKKIGYKQGFGKILAEGTKRAAKKIGKGADRFAIQIKGLEMAGWDPRGAIGMGLAYATANRGGCHATAATFWKEISDKKYPRWSTEGKAELTKSLQEDRAAMSALGVCYFTRPLTLETYARYATAVIGIEFTPAKLLLVGERIYNLERAFNVREGYRRKDDTLPRRLMEEAPTKGPSKGRLISPKDLDKMVSEYYALRGWSKDGVPTKAKLAELGLEEVAKKIGAK